MNTETPPLAPPLELSFTMSLELPCGCKLSCCIRDQFHSPVTPGNIAATSDSNKAKFTTWYQQRARSHRCDLVSEENPNGTEGHKA